MTEFIQSNNADAYLYGDYYSITLRGEMHSSLEDVGASCQLTHMLHATGQKGYRHLFVVGSNVRVHESQFYAEYLKTFVPAFDLNLVWTRNRSHSSGFIPVEYCYESKDVLISIDFSSHPCLTVLTSETEKVELLRKAFLEICEKTKIPTPKSLIGVVEVAFCFRNKEGEADSKSQSISVPSWDSLKENYSSKVQEKTQRLLSIDIPTDHGRLLVLSGPAGTGKTHFVKMLIREWRHKFCPIVVTDPEILFNDPSYYYSLNTLAVYRPWDYKPLKEDIGNLIIIEDGAEMLLKETRKSKGSALARLLNMTDGLIGQSKKDLFLITFNEDVTSIDPAFLRPGRCLGNLYFDALNGPEVKRWADSVNVLMDDLKTHVDLEYPLTLAQLYAARNRILNPGAAVLLDRDVTGEA